jgi:hypothetical protein
MRTRLFKILLCIGFLVGMERFCHHQTAGFTLSRIHSDLPFQAEPEMVDIAPILDQPFFYLDKGAQCYVFLSEDQKHVLKFFRFHRLDPPWWLPHFKLPGFLEIKRQAILSACQDRLSRHLNSYKLAFERLKQESGLVYIHLNKTDSLRKQLTIVDKIGIRHSLDLDSMGFILQKKAELVYPTFEKWIAKNERGLAREAIDQILALLINRSKMGIYDKDSNLATNFGFVEGRAVQIDVGRFCLKEKMTDRTALTRITAPFKQWLEERDPSLVLYLQEQLEEHAQNL